VIQDSRDEIGRAHRLTNRDARLKEITLDAGTTRGATMAKSFVRELGDGAVAGFLATIPMTVMMLMAHRRLPARQRYALPPKKNHLGVGQEPGS